MRLTRRAWNNIIIFSVATMILVFRYIEFRQQDSDPNIYRLLPAQATVLRLELPERVIERVGTQWRSEPQGSSPVAVIDAWLHAELTPWPNALVANAREQRVRVFLANHQTPIELRFFEHNGQHWVLNWQGQLLELDDATREALALNK